MLLQYLGGLIVAKGRDTHVSAADLLGVLILPGHRMQCVCREAKVCRLIVELWVALRGR